MTKTILTVLHSISFLAIIGAQEQVNIDLTKSKITWLREYTFYFGGSQGTIDIKEGFLIKSGDKISGGSFVIDMRTIKNTDVTKADANESLVNHLKDPDFFDGEHFPLSTLTIKNVEYEEGTRMKVYADMTIKGIPNPISFRAETKAETATFTSKFKIDRRSWNINYTSKFKDSAMSDAIGFIALTCIYFCLVNFLSNLFKF